jgi:hypothetical protein
VSLQPDVKLRRKLWQTRDCVGADIIAAVNIVSGIYDVINITATALRLLQIPI